VGGHGPADDHRVSVAHERRRHPRLRTILLVGMLVPTLGVGAFAVSVGTARWEQRQSSVRLAEVAESVGVTVDVVAALTEEQAHTTVHVLADAFGFPLPVGAPEALLEARARVDSLSAAKPAGTEPAFDHLAVMRGRFDAGALDFVELSQSFIAIGDELIRTWELRMQEIGAAADREEQPSWLRAHLRTLRESVQALVPTTERVRSSLHVDLGDRSPALVTELLRSNEQFAAALARLTPRPGSSAAEAWAAFHDDPAAKRMEDHLRRSEAVAMGTAPSPFASDMAALVLSLQDGTRWASLLADAVRASAADLEGAASRQARADERSLATWIAFTTLIVAASGAAAALVARRLEAPASALASAARRVASGDLDGERVEARGPQELVDTVEAFNDMAATLAAVEQSAVALAGYPDAPRPHALPGRTGQALQDAFDRLEASVREVERQRADLAVLAAHDELTGLLNRRAALDSLRRDLARVRREGRTVALLFVDLDGLKQLNDGYGHEVGDDALRAISWALATNVREGDLVARLGGDEFVVTTIIERGDEATVTALAERLLTAVREASVDTTDGPRALRCSIGVATSDEHSAPEDLLRLADGALYEAKRAGRDRVVWAARIP
jgi:diguanylate cyclase (GGDEF)-like protein